jgi:PiT family inorganic phosphate transporter
MGIGDSEHPRAVKWNKAGEILGTWVVTIPGSAIISMLSYGAVHLVVA